MLLVDHSLSKIIVKSLAFGSYLDLKNHILLQSLLSLIVCIVRIRWVTLSITCTGLRFQLTPVEEVKPPQHRMFRRLGLLS